MVEIKNIEELFYALASRSEPGHIKEVLESVGDSSEVIVNQYFGELNLCWKFFGNNDSNISTINLGSQPERSLIERITNALDAVLELQSVKRNDLTPKSPQDAAKKWFGRPPSGVDSGIFSWDNFSHQGHDKHVKVILLDGDDETRPTVDVLDDGIGIRPDDFEDTILSLQQGNKIKKHYLIGAFGQGGSSTLAFSEYAVILSRHAENPTEVGFTVVRQMILPDEWKENAYVYLTVLEDGEFKVPRLKVDEDFDLYEFVDGEKYYEENLEHGTLVRHSGYSLDKFKSSLSPATTSLYHLLHRMMFDPLLPFRVIDYRSQYEHKNELVTGSRNRLMRQVSIKVDEEDESGKTQLKHYAPIEMVSPLSHYEPSIGIEYWVVFNFRKSKDKHVLRSSSSEVYVSQNRPIIGTMNGQNQGEETSSFIRNLGYSQISRHMIIHIDVTGARREVRNEIFSSTREGFKQDRALEEIKNILANRLEEDEELARIEKELLADLLSSESTDLDEEVKSEITKLLRKSGYQATVKGIGGGGKGEDTGRPTDRPPGPTPPRPEPLPTLPYPQVTKFEIVFPEDLLEIPKGDNRIIRIETDANFRFDREDRLAIRAKPELLEVASKSHLRGGRIYWRLRATDEAEVGQTGKIIASLTKPGGEQLSSEIKYEVLPEREGKDKDGKGMVPDFEIRSVNPVEELDTFFRIWPDAEQEDIEEIAYRAQPVGEKIVVWYSTGFKPYASQITALQGKTTLTELFVQSYKIWIGYHAILQHQSQKNNDYSMYSIEDLDLDKLTDHERSIVAEMQVKQAVQTSELKYEQLKGQGGDE